MVTLRGVPLERIHLVNDWLAVVLGYVFNLALLWLMIKYNTEDMRSYRPILLLSTITDLAYLAVYAVVVPVLIAKGHFFIGFVANPLVDWLPEPFHAALFALFFVFYFFSVYSLAVPFAYRYMVLCRKKKHWGVGHFLAMLTVPIALVVIHCILHLWTGYSPTVPAEQRQAAMALVFNTNGSKAGGVAPDPDFVIAFLNRDRFRALILNVEAFVVLGIDYVLVFYFGWRIYHYLKTEELPNLDAKRAHELNVQVSTALLLQACVPLVLEFGPTTVVAMSVMTGIEAINYSGYTMAVVVWIAVVNPLVTMWVIRAYRQIVLGWLGVPWLGVSSSVTPS